MAGDVTIGALKRLSQLLAGQSKAAVSITGGAIDGAVIGATTPAAGTFTTLTATTLSTTSTMNPPIVVTAATLTLTAAANAGRVMLLSKVDGQTITLPAATGSGATYTFIINLTVTSVGTVIKVANASDAFVGFSQVVSDGAAAVLGYIAVANTDDTITLDGTTRGGYTGDVITIRDVAANRFAVEVRGKATGTEATPFSATV